MRKKREPLTHCKRGHEFTEQNTYIQPAKPGDTYIKRACKICLDANRAKWESENPEKTKAIKRKACDKWFANNPDYHKNHWLKKAYGLTPEEFEAKWTAQGGKCAICEGELKRDKSTHVDHDHDTLQVRDLLCQTCNHGIGSLQDSVAVVEKAALYLRKHKEPQLAAAS